MEKAKFWLKSLAELARNQGLSGREITEIREILTRRHQEIENAWNDHFGS